MMVIDARKIEVHWNYLLAIEDDLDRLSRYIEFDEKNFECFSIEISRILLTSAAEVDVVCKQICKKIKRESSADDIHQYREEIKPIYPNIPGFKILIPRYGLTLTPWDNWKEERGVPLWWTAYNKVKHHRDSEYHRANLKNALNSVAGLFVMVLYLYREKANNGELTPPPKLLRVTEEHCMGVDLGDMEFGIVYKL
jgi:hypothetical protein